MKHITAHPELVAYCGLYCGACREFLNEHCPGCGKNTKATWCKIRSCCIGNSYSSCGDCKDFNDVNDCGKFNNIISKLFAIVFRSNRKACIEQIRDGGLQKHAEIMAELGKHSLKR